MQISRHHLLAFAVAVLVTPTLVHAADNEAQIRARQALEEKMQQMTPAAPTNPAPVVSKPKPVEPKPVVEKPAPPVAPKTTVVESQPAPSTPVHVSTQSNDDATRQKLEEALHQSQPAATPVVPAPAPKAVVPEPAPKAVVTEPARPPVTPAPSMPVQSQPAPSTPAYVTTPSNDNATDQKLQDALHQKMQQAPAEPVAPVVTTQKPAKPAPAPAPAPVAKTAPTPAPKPAAKPAPAPTPAPASTANYAPVPESNTAHPALPAQPAPAPTPAPAHVASKQPQPAQPSITLPPLTGPATGLSAAKEQKLNDLLNQYRADQITPEQYHAERAKILAEP